MRLVESRTTLTITYVVLSVALFVALFPIALLVLNSLKPAAAIVQNPLSLPRDDPLGQFRARLEGRKVQPDLLQLGAADCDSPSSSSARRLP